MLTAQPNTGYQKRDLHVGGLGASASGALAAVTDPVIDSAESWLLRAREVAREADDYVHNNPWAALAVVAMLGVTAGYVLARRALP